MCRLPVLFVVAVSVTGCGDDAAQPFDLNHARVLAIRTEPPALLPGRVARVDVLVTDSTAIPREAPATTMTIALPAALDRPELAGLVARDDHGWIVQAPDAGVLAQIRTALELAPDAPIIVPLEIQVETTDGSLIANKAITLGVAADNPSPPTIMIAGDAMNEVTVRRGIETTLTVADPDPDLTFRWFSSIGDLEGFTHPEARITPELTTTGTVIVVVRDTAGGTAWTIAPAAVED